jgi:hypothetical protein
MPITINGTSGVTLTSQFDSASSFGFKNRIINGQMQIAQRATSATITAGSTIAAGYSTVDRFYVYCTGANVTAAQVAGSGANRNNLQITGAASVTAIGVGQRIESLNSYDMAGSTATLSVNLANSLLTTVTWTASYATTTADTFGTLASPTVTQIATGSFTVSPTLTNYSTQISIPAAATTGLQIVFTVGAQVSGTWTIGNVQLEKSSIATSYDYRSIGTELALAQRYFEIGNTWLQSPVGATASIGYLQQFSVSKRAQSVNTFSSITYGGGGGSGLTDYSASLPAPVGINGIGYYFVPTVPGGFVVFRWTSASEL